MKNFAGEGNKQIPTNFAVEQAAAGAALVPRDGRPAKLKNIIPGADYPVRCEIANHEYSFTARGSYWKGHDDALDLFLVEA